MENVDRTEFVVLTGHLDEQPLPDLIRRLRVQRKSGRLQVEYDDGPGSFFFEDGQLVDARLGTLRGLEALYAALSLDGASFNFNPLVRPPERSIDRQAQKFIWDLVEAPRREGLAEIDVAGRELDAAAAPPALPQNAPLQLPAAAELMAPIEERLTAIEETIISTSRRFTRERLFYALVISFLAGLSLVATLNAVFDPLGPAPASPTAAAFPARPTSEAAVNKDRQEAGAAVREGAAPPATSDSNRKTQPATEPSPPPVPKAAAVIGTRRAEGLPASRREYVVQVLVEVKDGRVTDARVWNPRPGAGAYEAVALKLARERTYPASFNGGERLRISVKP
ncbi:MAG TPA: DUF4388 domain-containing protein [Pyrinomonadaceae bacterium]